MNSKGSDVVQKTKLRSSIWDVPPNKKEHHERDDIMIWIESPNEDTFKNIKRYSNLLT